MKSRVTREPQKGHVKKSSSFITLGGKFKNAEQLAVF